MKLLAVLPYPGLRELILKVAEEFPDFQVTVLDGNLQQGVHAARGLSASDYDVILSRGGTSGLLSKTISIPVVNIALSGYDFWRTLSFTDNFTRKAAVVGFPNVLRDAVAAIEMLQSDIGAYPIEAEADLPALLDELQQKGYEVIIGDVITVETARERGLEGVLLTSGVESVRKAFEDAARLCAYLDKGNQIKAFAKTVLDHGPYAVAVFDRDGNAAYSTFTEEMMRAYSRRSAFGKDEGWLQIGDSIHRLSQAELADSSGAGYRACYLERTGTEPPGVKGVAVVRKAELQSRIPADIHLYTEYFGHELRAVRRLSAQGRAVLVTGSAGTGRERLARCAIRLEQETDVVLELDCSLLDETALAAAQELCDKLKGGGSVGTILLREPFCLEGNLQPLLYEWLKSPALSFPVLSTAESVPNHLLESGSFLEPLYCLIAEGSVRLPDLRERKNKISELAVYAINYANSVLGKQVVGVAEDAGRLLRDYRWEMNVEQLQRVLFHAVQLADGAYIRAKTIRLALQNERKAMTSARSSPISLDGTLDEIQQRIFQEVVRQENGNVSRAAKRLQIGRTTLWRKLSD